ncbi:mannitol dehydrogenase family protein [Microlunatus panaciterrae]|uniref:Mannitol 2-dehydrogenase n=1 Tax=Microlunatus panaciterrae TaxID=400768 RepID=A0ABS2RM06_9ACTN|nr:mannitol dehydrogenase family protein [Microlunatus panaciterrae]MBM7800039.1 mannitol 2-dehydrogenase [Microlunatus panaciterrae]
MNGKSARSKGGITERKVVEMDQRTEHEFLAGATPDLELPSYDRTGLKAGIVHFGVGGFHRAHQAMTIDRLLSAGLARDWAICGVGVLPGDRRMKDVMEAQDGLYTLLIKHPDGSRDARVIGSIIDYLLAPDDPEAVIERLAHQDTRIASLTVTEGGYNNHPVTGQFDKTNPQILADLAPDAVPATVFGLVTEALRRRRDRDLGAFTVMTCDNIQENGRVCHDAFLAFAELKDPELARWVDAETSFPNSMVDRITPVTSDEDRAEIKQRYGVEDAWPVVAEPFFQWVLEDHFVKGRPPYEEAGVQLVDDVEPYELMKLRLLNASHQALAYFGHLAGYTYAHEAAGDPLFAEFLLAYMRKEAAPTLKPVPGIDLGDYMETLIERFSNPEVRDTIARLAAESSDRIPKWLVPVIQQNLADGGEIRLSAAVVASWARYAEGVDEQGNPITVVDRLAESLKATAARQHDEPTAFIENRQLFADLVDDERFVSAYTWALDSLHKDGARATLQALVAR